MMGCETGVCSMYLIQVEEGRVAYLYDVYIVDVTRNKKTQAHAARSRVIGGNLYYAADGKVSLFQLHLELNFISLGVQVLGSESAPRMGNTVTTWSLFLSIRRASSHNTTMT